ncbi:hypothetical protein BGZ49_009894 [Haplosporangium sp. Z 27]|nr:hypothetical protein BGZ49_009894 [Haplosporangium sp. Z 27]
MQSSVAGCQGQGQVNIAITSREDTSCLLCVTKAKHTDLRNDVAKNIIQLNSLSNRKRKCDDIDEDATDCEDASPQALTLISPNALYSIVTDSQNWYFIKRKADISRMVSYFVSQVPGLFEYELDNWCMDAKEKFQQVVWLFETMLNRKRPA